MNDLISRQAAIEALSNGALLNYQFAGHHNGLVKAIDVIKGLPPAQSDIIRCKDCRYWERNTLRGGRRGKCKLTYIAVKGDYYCAVAQEKEN